MCCLSVAPALAEWSFNGSPLPNAFVQTNNMTLELQCDKIRFAPAGYEDSQDIVRKNGLSFRFLINGSQEVASFQLGRENSFVQIVDNYPVEIQFSDDADYAFVLVQIAANATLNLSMVDQDVSYGIFDLKGSGAAIQSLRAKEFVILDDASDEWDARVTVNGEVQRTMTSYSYFGNSEPVKDLVVALLAEDRAEFLIFRNRKENWQEFGDYRYDQCN